MRHLLRFFTPKNAIAEVIYTDIEPDIVINNTGQMFLLDINDDGITDFNFYSQLQILPTSLLWRY